MPIDDDEDEFFGFSEGDVVRLRGDRADLPPWTVTRLGLVGEDETPVATIMRSKEGGGVERELLHAAALVLWEPSVS